MDACKPTQPSASTWRKGRESSGGAQATEKRSQNPHFKDVISNTYTFVCLVLYT